MRSARLLLPLALNATGCLERDAGVVELAWVFVDRNGDPIYPGGVFSFTDQRDSCDLPGVTSQGPIVYDLRVQLEICDLSCDAGCTDPACQVVEPIRFPCRAARGTDPEVPASDEPYRFTVRAAIESNLSPNCLDPAPTCVAVPGARDRKVTPGLVTDLQVYQISVDVPNDGSPLDLEACGCV